MVCYVVLFVALNYWQVGRKEELDAEFDNTRQVLREFNKPRGPIVTADGIVAAVSYPDRPGDDPYKYRREYPTGDLLSEVTGYFTYRLRRRRRSSGSTATCSPARPPSSRCAASATCSRVRSTTPARSSWPLRADAQQVAKFLLGGRTGLDRRDGAGHRCGAGDVQQPELRPEHVRQRRVRGRPAGRSPTSRTPTANPLLSSAYQERFMPGSTFKVITTGIGLENGSLTLESPFPNESEWVPPQTNDPIQNYNGSTCGGDLAEVFARSCNIPFAKTAIAMGPEAFLAGAVGVGHRRGDPARHRWGRRELARQHRQPGQRTPAPRHPRLRAERDPDGAAAHGDGGRRRSPTAAR